MSAKSTSGLSVFISKGGATPTVLVPTGITSAKPAVVSIASTTGVLDGDVVVCTNTGFSELDNKSFVVANLSANTSFELAGSDTTGSTGTLAGAPTISHYAVADMQKVCLSSISINADEPGTVSVGTYCDPSASLPSAAASAGTLAFAGFVNTADADYAELLAAVDDGVVRYLRIDLPTNGYIIAPLTFASMTWDLPLDGAVGFSGTAVLGSQARHVF